jgi:hypothetical protein
VKAQYPSRLSTRRADGSALCRRNTRHIWTPCRSARSYSALGDHLTHRVAAMRIRGLSGLDQSLPASTRAALWKDNCPSPFWGSASPGD